MSMLTLAQAHALLPGSARMGDGNTPIHRVHTDTRTLRSGDLFVALKGERFDGNDYLAQARAAGAVAALAERGLAADNVDTLPGLQVADSLLALQTLATAWRAQFTLPLIAVTGSNGKTTVTQMVASILRSWLDGGNNGKTSGNDSDNSAALATAGNFNNHIGVPLTLLRLRAGHRAAVLELGMNHPGEIALLAMLAAPTVVLVNNAQREHQEFMATVDAVARENGSAIAALPADGTVVIPAADAFAGLWREMAAADAERSQRRVLSFGLQDGDDATATVVADSSPNAAPVEATTDTKPDVTADAAWSSSAQHWTLALHTPAGSVPTILRLPGRHNVLNALAAAACALAAGAPLAAIADGIAAFAPVAGRSQLLQVRLQGQPVALVDDSYNANPDSVLAAIDVLAGLPGPRWLVLGDMGEVGSDGPRFHAEAGAHARSAGIDHVWAAGALCAHLAADRHFGSVAELLNALPQAPTAASVLVKGSRFMRMEQVVQALQQHNKNKTEDHACC